MNKSFGEFFLNCKECILENPRSFYGSFSLGPFQNSQSLTIANAFRRTLLTEIGGVAITHVQIDGVFHEYSTIEGVRESVLDILLNFKQIVLKTSKPLAKPIYGYLNVRGPGIVRISDLKLPPTLQYVDPDQYIATLNENGKLCLKVLISDFSSLNTFGGTIFGDQLKKGSVLANSSNHVVTSNSEEEEETLAFTSAAAAAAATSSKKRIEGMGFSSAAAAAVSGLKTPFLSVDATLNPILKVNYLIENLQPIQKSLQNQVIHIELWTNGSIHPRNAIKFTITFLKNMFEKFDDMDKISSTIAKEFFESDETLLKILKSFEYDFHLYGALEAKKISNSFLAFPEGRFQSQLFSGSSFVGDEKVDEDGNLCIQTGFGLQPEHKKNPWLHGEDFSNHSENLQLEQKSWPFQKISFHSSIHVLNLPYRVSECLIRNKFFTLGDLVKFRKKEFAQFSGIGNFSLSLIEKKLKKFGFAFKS